MTNKQLEALNVKIAKKLGWKNFRIENTPEPMNTRRMCAVAPGNIRRQFVPHFTSNLAYAMQIVNWATDHHYNFSIERREGEKVYKAWFWTDGWDTISSRAEGTLPSMAICLAFLKIK